MESVHTLVMVLVAAGLTLALLGFHRMVRHGLAPERVVEQRTPASFGMAFDVVRLPTANGRNLFGWWLPVSDTGETPTVVLLHGWGGNAETLLPLATPLVRAGFAVLLFDARCHGQSDEDSFASMPRFAEDLEHALDWVRHQRSVDAQRVAIVGHSVGAAAALLAASRRQDLAAVVSIAAFSHPRTVMRRLLAAKHVPYWPIGWYILQYVQHVIGHRFDAIAPLTTIGRIRCPALLVHGADDATVPVAEARAIYAARGVAPVQLTVVAGSHDDFGDIQQEGALVVEFLWQHLAGGPTHD